MDSVRDHRVAVLVLDGAKALDVGIAAHVFAKRPSMPYEVRVCGERAGTVDGWNGLAYSVGHDLETLAWADTILVPGCRNPAEATVPAAVISSLNAAHGRGTRIAAISTGAFTLAAAGLLDGLRATTHWHYTHVLHQKFPQIDVDENVLFVDAGQVLTSAGAASGIDLALHLLRRDHGVALANSVARRLVSAPYRSGGQAQYVPRSIPEPLGDVFAATRAWALDHLQEELPLTALARHAHVSPRTFSRRFTADTGITAMQWVLRARIDRARELLERTDLTVTQIAEASGLRSDTNLRRHFGSILGASPSAYRAAFQDGSSASSGSRRADARLDTEARGSRSTNLILPGDASARALRASRAAPPPGHLAEVVLVLGAEQRAQRLLLSGDLAPVHHRREKRRGQERRPGPPVDGAGEQQPDDAEVDRVAGAAERSGADQGRRPGQAVRAHRGAFTYERHSRRPHQREPSRGEDPGRSAGGGGAARSAREGQLGERARPRYDGRREHGALGVRGGDVGILRCSGHTRIIAARRPADHPSPPSRPARTAPTAVRSPRGSPRRLSPGPGVERRGTVHYRDAVQNSVREATVADIPSAARTLAVAFDDYPWTRWSIPEEQYAARLEELQAVYLRHALTCGVVLVDDAVEGVAALLPPGAPAPADEDQARIMRLLGDRLETFLAAELPPRPAGAWELATLGVHPSNRGLGLGSALLAAGLDQADRRGEPVALETSDPRNVVLYSRHGFSLTATTRIPAGPAVHSMLRGPRTLPGSTVP